MKCVAIRHVPFEDLGTLGKVLHRRGWEVTYLDCAPGSSLPAAAGDSDLLVILGGPMGVYEADRHPFLREEIALAADRLRRDRPILGICLGSQVMAAALGGAVRPGNEAEIGWFPVEMEREGEGDPAFSRLFSEDPHFLHWHRDTFDLPSGAAPLARSRRTPRQGFRFRENGYAIQFHLEVDPAKIHSWTRGLRRQIDSTPGAQTAGEIEAGASRHGPAMARQAGAFLEAWLDRLP